MAQSILIADDDIDTLQFLTEELESFGYRVITAIDGQTAVALANSENPDLILLDVAMPMRSGLNAFELLRKSKSTWKIPVIFISGMPSGKIYPAIADAQRVAHLKKPVDPDDLRTLVREFLAKYPAQ